MTDTSLEGERMETVSTTAPAARVASAILRIDKQLLDTRIYLADLEGSHNDLLGELSQAVCVFLQADEDYVPEPVVIEALGGDFSRSVLIRSACQLGFMHAPEREDALGSYTEWETAEGKGIAARIEAVTP